MKVKAQKHLGVVDTLKSKHGENCIKVLNWTVLGVFILFVLYFTVGQYSAFLWRLQEFDLFVNTRQYFVDNTQRLGGLTLYVGSFLNQFFYYPWLGSLIYLLMLLLVSYMTAKAFGLKGRTYPLAFLPSLALLLSITELGYMIYVLKVEGYVYVNILGILCALLGLILFQKIKPVGLNVLFVIAWLLIFYPICGIYALFGGLLIMLASLKQYAGSKDRKSLIPVLATLPSLFLIPFLYYQFVFDETFFNNLPFVNLPNFSVKGAEKILWLPFLLMALFFFFAVLWKRKRVLTKPAFIDKGMPIILFLAGLIVVTVFSYRDENFKTELAMQSAAENGDWNDVLKLAGKQQDEPTRLIVMHTNLALYRLGLAGDNMFHYKNGNKAINTPRTILPIQMAGTFFYYQYGQLNYCYRWCMEGMVEYGMDVSVLKYFVLSSILNGETALAQKYNDILNSTLFYKSWAMKHQTFIDHPEGIQKSPEFENILTLTAYDDMLDGDHSMLENFLRNNFASMQGGPTALVELSILYNLELKSIDGFWPRLFFWARTQKHIPVHFQEAALLYEHLEHKVNLAGAPFDKEVVTNFQNFLAFIQKYANYPEESVKMLYYNQFGDTFWYYYFFVKDDSTSKKSAEKTPY